jgi:hypothetical protein
LASISINVIEKVETMTENVQEANELLEKLKKSLPIYACLTKEMCSHLNNQKHIKIKPKKPLKITEVLYGGDASGITCAVELKKHKEVLAISLTYLRFNQLGFIPRPSGSFQNKQSFAKLF